MTPVYLSTKTVSGAIQCILIFSFWGGGSGGGVLPIMGYTGRLHLKSLPFSGFRYSEKEGISLVEVYKRLGNSNLLFQSVRGLERACKGKKLIEMIFFAAGERG